ncbi:MAG TPA: AraC family transcriptional regulator [Gammaproteobacteria bacterium]
MTYRSNTECALVRPELAAVQQLRSLVAELVTALGDLLNDERASAEASLSRAAALLQRTEAPRPTETQELRGVLAPWQIRKIAAHIESNLGRSLRSGDLAALVRLSPAHFSRTFRNTFGCSPLEYVTQRRMERAQGLMLSTDVPLAQIALDCGLADQAHFSRVFRKVVGECPRAWRRARVNVLELRELAASRPTRLVAERCVQEVVDR